MGDFGRPTRQEVGPVLFSRRSRRARRKRRRPSPSLRLSAESRRATPKQRLGRVIVACRLAPGNAAADRSPGGLNLRLGRRADASARFCQRSSTSVSRPSKSFSQSAPTSHLPVSLSLGPRKPLPGTSRTRRHRCYPRRTHGGSAQALRSRPRPSCSFTRSPKATSPKPGVRFCRGCLRDASYPLSPPKERQLPLRISLLRRIFTLHCRI